MNYGLLKCQSTAWVCLSLALLLFFFVNGDSFEANGVAPAKTTTSRNTAPANQARLTKKYNAQFAQAVQCSEKWQYITTTIEEKLECAKNFWALGLVGQASQIWNTVLNDPNLIGVERYRSQLSWAMLEMQTANFEKARALAQDILAELYDSNFKAQFLLLIGQSWTAEGNFEKALADYQLAYQTGDEVVQSEAKFLMAENKLKLKRVLEARQDYIGVDSASEYALPALLQLIKIDFEQEDYEAVLIWNKEIHDNHFVKPELQWLRYVTIEALIKTHNFNTALEEFKKAESEMQKTNTWYVLSVAAIEEERARQELNSMNYKY
ncbi:MAG: tetratricopeptide repeat protein [Deltaproteobacteria bacterium]|jgi:tetratricopeptide (TPR) repeat protein|nr:tetratricopeptide repeat protein [Deltaproteobacteria bacterium]